MGIIQAALVGGTNYGFLEYLEEEGEVYVKAEGRIAVVDPDVRYTTYLDSFRYDVEREGWWLQRVNLDKLNFKEDVEKTIGHLLVIAIQKIHIPVVGFEYFFSESDGEVSADDESGQREATSKVVRLREALEGFGVSDTADYLKCRRCRRKCDEGLVLLSVEDFEVTL